MDISEAGMLLAIRGWIEGTVPGSGLKAWNNGQATLNAVDTADWRYRNTIDTGGDQVHAYNAAISDFMQTINGWINSVTGLTAVNTSNPAQWTWKGSPIATLQQAMAASPAPSPSPVTVTTPTSTNLPTMIAQPVDLSLAPISQPILQAVGSPSAPLSWFQRLVRATLAYEAPLMGALGIPTPR